MQPESVLHFKKLPRQISLEEAAAVEHAGTTFSNTIIAVLTASFTVSLLIAGPLNQILSAIKHLQIISTIMLISLCLPANANIFF